MKYIGNVTTPTLVIHSEQDLRCAIEQDEQVFVALKRLGVDTEMIRFPDEPHGLSRNGRTDRPPRCKVRKYVLLVRPLPEKGFQRDPVRSNRSLHDSLS